VARILLDLCTVRVAVTSLTLDSSAGSRDECGFTKDCIAKKSARRKYFVLLCRTVGFKFSQHQMATAHNNICAFRSKLRAPADSSISKQGKRLF
jgi:hypothetical protein